MLDLTSPAVQTPAAEYAKKINHRHHCERRDSTKVMLGRQGDPIVMCRSCGAFRVVEGVRTPEPAVAAPQPKPARLRCRVHHEEAVTWRGTGCRECAKERAEKLAEESER